MNVPPIEVMGVAVEPVNANVYPSTVEKAWWFATHLQGLADAYYGDPSSVKPSFIAPEGCELIVAAFNKVGDALCKAPWARHGGNVARAEEFREGD
jgi:hypothetical protein